MQVKHLIFFLTFGICIILFQCASRESELPVAEYPARVGDIAANPAIDDADFRPCDEDWIQQHYSFRDLYKGGKQAIEAAYKQINPSQFESDIRGYITIRFLINCRLETGRFRVQEMNFDYQPTHFPQELIDQLLAATKTLDQWQPANYKKRAYDYYQYLTFKIDAGKIAAILP